MGGRGSAAHFLAAPIRVEYIDRRSVLLTCNVN